MDKPTSSTVSLVVNPAFAYLFNPFLQQGFSVFAVVGCSIKDLICGQFGVNPEYLSSRIKTIFLNGQPVDDAGSAIVHDGSVIALSAAMPGLVGATFRSQGPLSVFRSSITYRREENDPGNSAEGFVTLKLFNLLVPEMGPAFLKKGVWLKAGIIGAFFKDKGTIWKEAFQSVLIDGRESGPDAFNNLKGDDDRLLVNLIVTPAKQ